MKAQALFNSELKKAKIFYGEQDLEKIYDYLNDVILEDLCSIFNYDFYDVIQYTVLSEILSQDRGAKPLSNDNDNKPRSTVRRFDFNADYDAICFDFKRLGYDLFFEDIDYALFNFYIDNLIDQDNSAIFLRITSREAKKKSVPLSLTR